MNGVWSIKKSASQPAVITKLSNPLWQTPPWKTWKNTPGRRHDPARAQVNQQKKDAKRLFEDTDLALLGRAAGSIIEMPIYLMGFQNWMLRLGSDPIFAAALLDKITAVQMNFDRVLLQATAKYLNITRSAVKTLVCRPVLCIPTVCSRNFSFPARNAAGKPYANTWRRQIRG